MIDYSFGVYVFCLRLNLACFFRYLYVLDVRRQLASCRATLAICNYYCKKCFRNTLETQSDTAAPQGHRSLEARRWEARYRQSSATSAENNTLLVRPWGPNCLILEAKTFKISPKRLPKSLKYRCCVYKHFLERPWATKCRSELKAWGLAHLFPGPFWDTLSIKCI